MSPKFVYVIVVVVPTLPSPAAVVVELGNTLFGVLEIGNPTVTTVSVAVPMHAGGGLNASEQDDCLVGRQTGVPFVQLPSSM
jgi:hypothetical protein